ncbi:MAG: sigma-70 family RNA polymerase sigma factor [Flavobacteriales bacterium]|jgi:RNA polymerase primary sigma factor|nr:sigma-70 family RNA polymerase sigma factor [Flavobacteriales bacterium]NCG28986.1 sigma-70 family RNA polymerase sigma factor [Bacteroidota bacterium]MBT3963710.1 sigma-70 family RNA polymerase sigma factor [Flavobacteriales bacterium]MBT4706010.1 sigma-70 family RNA polymerase sigma factor [Flavobacteriales bacterium]MBT4931468.1 sigma-70 family RNA polymerase sigma factor [Flavobacteriales bacterium]
MRQLKITKQLTNRDSKSIDKYLSDVSKEEMITAEEEVRLAVRIKQGDEASLNKLVSANLRFVISVAKQYQGHGLTLEDLIAEGNIGLIIAAKRFDETKGFKFISYAVWWIRQSIMQAIAENSRVVRLPLNKVSAIQKVAQAFSQLEQRYERAPSNDEIGELLESNADSVGDLFVYAQKQVSVDAPLMEGEDNSLLHVMANGDSDIPTELLMHESLRRDIERVLVNLKEREADVLRLSFGLNGIPPMTLEEIANNLGLTRERIRQIREKGLRNLRKKANSHLLKNYL